ncbi:hypothetical protein BDZ91DRAFT_664728 [Kalaharituber pfeilii]|nr:hypothetical protein BDZ91DRAFT_664728 [Kalaharituber pfeilii]
MVSPSLLEPTSPDVEPAWLDSPARRGTFDVFTSCVLTLVLCVWTAVHPDVPAPARRGFWQCFVIRSWWVLIGLLAPEYLLWQAIRQYLKARGICKQAQVHRRTFVVYGYGPPVLQLSPETVMILVKLGLIAPNSDVLNEEHIKDKSKADNLAKLLVCGQASWIIVQCIGQKITGLPITLLEINTVMHVVCALLMYLVWLKKPQEANVPIVLSDSTPDAVLSLYLSAMYEGHDTTRRIQRGFLDEPAYLSSRLGAMSGGDGLEGLLYDPICMLCMSGLTALYGSTHLIPWNSHFPTALERYIWRVSCCVIAGGVTTWFALVLVVLTCTACCGEAENEAKEEAEEAEEESEEEAAGAIKVLVWIAKFVVLPIYTLARIFIFIEGFASLRSLRRGAYDTVPWTDFWPHY